MKILILSACAAMTPFAALGDVTEAERAEINTIAQSFSESVKAANGIEHSIAALHPPFADAMANAYGFQSRDAFFDQIRQGYAQSTSLIEVISHDVHFEAAQYGETGEWTWGMVPYSAQSRQKADDQWLPESCSSLLVFGRDDVWYQYTLNQRTNSVFIEVLPEFMFVNFFSPDCTTGPDLW